jgi:hypothetical protein
MPSKTMRARAFFQGLAQLHIAGGQGPETASRFDGAAAQQHRIASRDDRANHQFGVLIGDMAAIGAHHTLAVVAFRDTADEIRHGEKVTLPPAGINPASVFFSPWAVRRPGRHQALG